MVVNAGNGSGASLSSCTVWTRPRGIRLWGEAGDGVDLVSRNISIGKFGAPHIVIQKRRKEITLTEV